MAEALDVGLPAERAAEVQVAIDKVIAEVKELRKQMQTEQAGIEKSRARTRVLLNRLKTA